MWNDIYFLAMYSQKEKLKVPIALKKLLKIQLLSEIFNSQHSTKFKRNCQIPIHGSST
jgi:hypothetical protein